MVSMVCMVSMYSMDTMNSMYVYGLYGESLPPNNGLFVVKALNRNML